MPIIETSINSLPAELLFSIFEYLSPSDRAEASLVCQRWFVIANHLSYLKNDTKLVIRRQKVSNSELSFLIGGFRTIRCVSLDDVQFGASSDDFWRCMGETVTELELVRCNFLDNDTLCGILRHLKKLKSLKLFAPCFSKWNLFRKDSMLVTRGNRRDIEGALHSITHLTLSDAGVNSAHFRNLLGALPNLTSLNTASLYFQPHSPEDRYLSRRCLLDWLSDRASKVQEIQLKHVDNDFLHDISQVRGLKLQRVSFQLEGVDEQHLRAFVESQKPSLRHLELFLADLQPGVLQYCSQIASLRSLKLDSDVPADFHRLQLPQNLQILALDSSPDMAEEHKIQPHPQLRELQLNRPLAAKHVVRLESVVSRFPNLTSFRYDGVLLSDQQLEILFRGLPALQHLHLKRCENISDNGILGLGQLQGLVSLTLQDVSQLSEEAVKGFKFPHLRHLQLLNLQHVSEGTLEQLCQKCPCLETIRIWTLTPTAVISADLRRRFPRLERVDVQHCRDLLRIKPF